MSALRENIKTTKFSKELLEGIKYFYDYKTKIFTKYSIKDIEAFKKLQNEILAIKNIEELKLMRRKITSIGMTSVKNFNILEKFYVFLIEKVNVSKIPELKFLKEDFLVDFLYEKSLQRKSSTIMLDKVILGDFFRFLDKRCGYDFDFSLRGMKFNKEVSLPVFLPESKFLDFIEYLKHQDFKKDYEKKNRLMVLIVSLSGCRSAEVRNLQLSDFKITIDRNGEEYYSLKLNGKGNKERMAAINKKDLEKPLQQWLDCPLRKRKYNQKFLFCTDNSKSDTTRHFLQKTFKELKIEEKKLGLHILRHSFASYVYQNTKDLILTQNLLGHSSIEVTKIYVHKTIDFSEQVLSLF